MNPVLGKDGKWIVKKRVVQDDSISNEKMVESILLGTADTISIICEYRHLLKKAERCKEIFSYDRKSSPPVPPPSAHSEPEDGILPQEFLFQPKHVAMILEKFASIERLSMVTLSSFIFVMEDLIALSKSNSPMSKNIHLPPAWHQLTHSQLVKLSNLIMVQRGYINWKNFVIACLDIRSPTQEEILDILTQFRTLDPSIINRVDKNKFDLVTLWFEHTNPKEIIQDISPQQWRECIFQLFCDTSNLFQYIEFLLYFCKDLDFRVGFLNSLALLTSHGIQFEIPTSAESENLPVTDSELEMLFSEQDVLINFDVMDEGADEPHALGHQRINLRRRMTMLIEQREQLHRYRQELLAAEDLEVEEDEEQQLSSPSRLLDSPDKPSTGSTPTPTKSANFDIKARSVGRVRTPDKDKPSREPPALPSDIRQKNLSRGQALTLPPPETEPLSELEMETEEETEEYENEEEEDEDEEEEGGEGDDDEWNLAQNLPASEEDRQASPSTSDKKSKSEKKSKKKNKRADSVTLDGKLKKDGSIVTSKTSKKDKKAGKKGGKQQQGHRAHEHKKGVVASLDSGPLGADSTVISNSTTNKEDFLTTPLELEGEEYEGEDEYFKGPEEVVVNPNLIPLEAFLQSLWFGHITSYPIRNQSFSSAGFLKLKELTESVYEEIFLAGAPDNVDPYYAKFFDLLQHPFVKEILKRYKGFETLDINSKLNDVLHMPQEEEETGAESDVDSLPDSVPSVELLPLLPSPILSFSTFNESFSKIFSCLSLNSHPSGASVQSGNMEAGRGNLVPTSVARLLSGEFVGSNFKFGEVEGEVETEVVVSASRIGSTQLVEVMRPVDRLSSTMPIRSFGSFSQTEANVPGTESQLGEMHDSREGSHQGLEEGTGPGEVVVVGIEEESIQQSSSNESVESKIKMSRRFSQLLKRGNEKFSPMDFGLDPNLGSLLF